MKRLRSIVVSYLRLPQFRKHRTVRVMFSVSILGALIYLGANVISTTNVSYVRLEVDKNIIIQGDRFSLDLYAFAHVPVNAVDVTLSFDSNAVEVLGVDRGQSVLTIWTEDPIIETDKVILRGGTFKKGFIGEHKIATVQLRAKQTGQSELFAANVLLLAGDGRGTPVRVSEADDSRLSVYVYDENESPENIGIDVAVVVVTDIDGDGDVTLRDVSSFMGAWSNNSRVFDFNGDGKMTFKDFSIILSKVLLGR